MSNNPENSLNLNRWAPSGSEPASGELAFGGPALGHYDVVVVGARAAGAATAMLLARRGLRVLAVDRQAYGSDTLSTHALMRGAVVRLARWGLLDRIWDDGTPVIEHTDFTYGDETFSIPIRPEPGVPGLAAPRRTSLDPILVDGARVSGAEVLHRTSVRSLITDDARNPDRVTGVALTLADGREVTVSADLVIGADGRQSFVARSVGAPVIREARFSSAVTIGYYEDLDVDHHRFRWLFRRNGGGGVIPTTGGQVCIFTGMEPGFFKRSGRDDVAATHNRNIAALDPDLGVAVAAATSFGRLRSFPGAPGFFRRSHGPGWALVGDAGYFKDPYGAHGITDAFRDAERLTDAVLTGDLAGYEAERDELSMPMFTVLDRIASYEWDLNELQGLHRSLSEIMKAEEQNVTAEPATEPIGAVAAPAELLTVAA